MPIDLNMAQARKVAELASELGGEISLHQVTRGADVYVGPAGSDHRFLISATSAGREPGLARCDCSFSPPSR